MFNPTSLFVSFSLIFILSGQIIFAQQEPMFTQFSTNILTFNPAFTNPTDEKHNLSLLVRNQWTGFEGAPVTQFLSYHHLIKKFHSTAGASLLNDKAGALGIKLLNIFYSYEFVFNDKNILAIGLQTSLLNARIYNSMIQTTDPGDPVTTSSTLSRWTGDVNFGIFYLYKNFRTGFSAPHLFSGKMYLQTDNNTGLKSRLIPHGLFYSEYKFKINRDYSLKTAGLVKFTKGDYQWEINSKITVFDKFITGIGFRYFESIPAFLGYVWEEKVYFTYSYDFVVASLQRYQYGSHEVGVRYRF